MKSNIKKRVYQNENFGTPVRKILRLYQVKRFLEVEIET